MEEVCSNIHLNLQLLDEDYVKSVWEDGFIANELTLPKDYEVHLKSIPLAKVLKEFTQVLVLNVENGAVESWHTLVESKLDHKKLLCVLHHIMNAALQGTCNVENCASGIQAASLYFALLAIPDFRVYRIYQAELLSRAMNMILRAEKCQKNSVPMKKVRGGRRAQMAQNADRDGSVGLLSECECKHLLVYLNSLLTDCMRCLKMGKLRHCEEAVGTIADALASLSRLETSQVLIRDAEPLMVDSRIYTLSYNAFLGLHLLCDTRHGDTEKIMKVIFRNMFKSMQVAYQRESILSPKDASNVKDNAINFVHFLVREYPLQTSSSLNILMEHLCMLAPERAEQRNKAADDVIQIIQKLPQELCCKILLHPLLELTCNEKGSPRLFAVDVIGRFVFKLQQLMQTMPNECQERWHKILFASVIARITDVAASVRTRALTILADYIHLATNSPDKQLMLSVIFVDPYREVQAVFETPSKCLQSFNLFVRDLVKHPDMDINANVLPHGLAVVKDLLCLLNDSKVFVRKAALLCLLRLLKLNMQYMTESVLKKVSSHCRDEALMVRKMMVQELTDLLVHYPKHDDLPKVWVVNVIPLVIDPEVKVVEKVVECLQVAMFDNLVEEPYTSSPRFVLPWKLMELISSLQMRKFFLKACGMLDSSVFRPAKLLAILRTHIGRGKVYNNAAWAMLLTLAQYITIKDPLFVLDFYHSDVRNVANVSTYLSQLVMEVLWLTWRKLPPQHQNSLEEELDMDLALFKVPIPLISRGIDIRHAIHMERNGANRQMTKTDPKVFPGHADWAIKLVKKSEESIFDMLRARAEEIQDEEAMKRFVTTLGNIVHYCPQIIEDRTINQLQYMLCPPATGTDSLWVGECSNEMKAALIIALGKLSLQNEIRARVIAEIFGQLLKDTDESLLKHNVMVCLTDLCIRYASLVECLLPEMCICLKDPQRAVRENTLVLLTQLLQEDYLKLRDGLIFHLLTMLIDVDVIISSMTRYFFVDSVLRRKKKCFSSIFIQAIFYYNKYMNHPQYSKILLTKREEEVFNMSGPNLLDVRQEIYRFMLSHVEDEDRFNIYALLCVEICKGVLEDKVTLDEAGHGVLKDALFAMGCDEIRLTYSKDAEVEAVDEDVSDIAVTRELLLATVAKDCIVKTEIPALVELRKKLGEMQSPLVQDVLVHLQQVIREYKINLKDIFPEDPDLVRDVLLDLRRVEDVDCDGDSESGESSGSE